MKNLPSYINLCTRFVLTLLGLSAMVGLPLYFGWEESYSRYYTHSPFLFTIIFNILAVGLLIHRNHEWKYPSIFLILLAIFGGIISFLSPCNVATLPTFSSYIGSQAKTTRKSITMSLIFSLGFCLMFSVIATLFIIISGFIRFTFWFNLFSGLTVICLASYVFLRELQISSVKEINSHTFKRNETTEINNNSKLNNELMKYEGYSGAFLLGFSMGFSWIA